MYSVNKFDRTKLKTTRIERKLSRAQVAQRAKCTISTVFRIEKLGTGNLDNVGAICKILKLEIADVLLPEHDEQQKTA